MRLLALDPGIRGCGVALFDDNGRLAACDYVKNPVTKGDDFTAVLSLVQRVVVWVSDASTVSIRFHEVVAEWPRVYTIAKSKGDPNDLMPLVGIGCAVATSAMNATRVYPHEWKGQMTKEVCHQRIRSRLDLDETNILNDACLRAKSLAHNVLDSVGIGLHHLGRFEPKRSWEG